MYTRCPECNTAYRIDIKQLRAGRGEALCERCHTVFNALASLSTTVKDAAVPPGPARMVNTPVLGDRDAVVLPRFERDRLEELDGAEMPAIRGGTDMLKPDGRRPEALYAELVPEVWAWAAGAALLLMLLVGQAMAFEGRRLAQNVHARPWMDRICATLGCVLPPFRDVANLRVTDRLLTMAGGPRDGFEFSLVFANESELPQAYPKLRLVLNELSGRPAAERVFDPFEYLPDWHEGRLVPVGTPVQVSLALARPSREVGGFTIEFE
jgi:predicted Zn finger-like uncharacterized protein